MPAQNDSRIIGVVVNDHQKYERHALEDHFIAASLNYLSKEMENAGFFMMVKVTKEWNAVNFCGAWEKMYMLPFMGILEQKIVRHLSGNCRFLRSISSCRWRNVSGWQFLLSFLKSGNG